MIQIGRFTIDICRHGGFWISIDGGEGMQTSLEKLEALLDQFWDNEF